MQCTTCVLIYQCYVVMREDQKCCTIIHVLHVIYCLPTTQNYLPKCIYCIQCFGLSSSETGSHTLIVALQFLPLCT